MSKIEFKWALLVTLIVMVAGWFYWFHYRPEQVRNECGAFTARAGAQNEMDVRALEFLQKACENAGSVDALRKAISDGRASKKQ